MYYYTVLLITLPDLAKKDLDQLIANQIVLVLKVFFH